jgi:hypothetical protein
MYTRFPACKFVRLMGPKGRKKAADHLGGSIPAKATPQNPYATIVVPPSLIPTVRPGLSCPIGDLTVPPYDSHYSEADENQINAP